MDIVDKNGNVIGKAIREEIHGLGKWHRGIHVFVFDRTGQQLLPTRSSAKDKFPATYDFSVSDV